MKHMQIIFLSKDTSGRAGMTKSRKIPSCKSRKEEICLQQRAVGSLTQGTVVQQVIPSISIPDASWFNKTRHYY